MLTPEQRRLRAQVAANTRWALAREGDGQLSARRGQAGLLRRFEAQVPAEITDPIERTRRAEQLRRAYMQRLRLASSRARSRKAVADAATP
jgi:hypothetical protein